MAAREDDPEDTTRFRSDRFFCEQGQWYFTTREGPIKGPFSSRDDAEQELMLYLRELRQKEAFGVQND